MDIGSRELIRNINRKRIIETVIETGGTSRASLAKLTGLTKATTGSISQCLIDDGILIETGSGDAYVGRKPTIMKLNANLGFSIGIELGENHIFIMATDLLGNSIYTDKQRYNKNISEDISAGIKCIADRALTACQLQNSRLVGITIAVHGIIHNNSIVFAPFYAELPESLVGELSARYGVPVRLYNEANLAALGENIFSAKLNNLACLYVHPGLGLGVIFSGRLYKGSNGFAGELGHTTIVPDGRQCVCGAQGCLDAYVSQTVLFDELARLKGMEKIDFPHYAELYRNGDPDAEKITNDFIKYISIAINNVLNLYNPEAVVLNSDFTHTFPEIFDLIKTNLNPRSNIHSVRLSSMNKNAVLYGAASVNIIKFLEIDIFNPNALFKPSI